jgi:hypothetical protein
VYVVAIAELGATAETEVAPLAADLGVVAYDARLLLAQGLPAVVLQTPDKARALGLLAKIRARGNGAMACDAAAVVSSDAMVSMRRFRLEGDAVSLDDRPGDRLPFTEVLALVPAIHRIRADTTSVTKSTKFSASRMLITGGLSMTKTVKTESRSTTEAREHVLYVFRRDGETPWLLEEQGTSWAGLGRPPAPSGYENFRATIAELRARAPAATYDERLLTRKAAPERAALTGGVRSTTVKTSSEAGVDLLAHLIATWVLRQQRGDEPYRDPEGPAGEGERSA